MSEEFQDFTVAERKLFQDVLKQPFSRWQVVLRWAISDMSFSFMQDVDPADVEMIAGLRGDDSAVLLVDAPEAIEDGDPIPDGYEFDATREGITASLLREGKLTEDLARLSAILDESGAANAVHWIWEVSANSDFENPLDLRREVSDQLQAEMLSAGDCGTWLCFLAWVVRGREPGRRETWKEWSKVTDGQEALDAGTEYFVAWRTMRVSKERDIVGAPKGKPEVPLESTGVEISEPPM